MQDLVNHHHSSPKKSSVYSTKSSLSRLDWDLLGISTKNRKGSAKKSSSSLVVSLDGLKYFPQPLVTDSLLVVKLCRILIGQLVKNKTTDLGQI